MDPHLQLQFGYWKEKKLKLMVFFLTEFVYILVFVYILWVFDYISVY